MDGAYYRRLGKHPVNWIGISNENEFYSQHYLPHQKLRVPQYLVGVSVPLALTAEKRWRKIRGFKRLPDVIEGIRFQDGIAIITASEKTEETQQMAA